VVTLVPIMLLVRPIFCRKKPRTDIQREQQEIELAESYERRDSETLENNKHISMQNTQLRTIRQQLKAMGKKEKEDTFGEAFIHQMIETIEFVLGTVSNTASYLRLWALSLAHSQLAEVFFNLIFSHSLKIHGGRWKTILTAVLLWPLFWSITFAVLMLMDLLECVLHTLRLHWVEFQNKFYKGEGYNFRPFSYEVVLTKALEQE